MVDRVTLTDATSLDQHSQANQNHYTVTNPLDECQLFSAKGLPMLMQKLQSHEDRELLQQLPPKHAGMEKLIFASQVVKINHRKKRQKRVIVLTNLALYNFGVNRYKSCKRRISLRDVDSLQTNAANDSEFVVKVSSSYDYRFEASNAKALVASICAAWDELELCANTTPSKHLHVYKLTDHKMIEATMVKKSSLKVKAAIQSKKKVSHQKLQKELTSKPSLLDMAKRRFSISPALQDADSQGRSNIEAPGVSNTKSRRKSIVDIMSAVSPNLENESKLASVNASKNDEWGETLHSDRSIGKSRGIPRTNQVAHRPPSHSGARLRSRRLSMRDFLSASHGSVSPDVLMGSIIGAKTNKGGSFGELIRDDSVGESESGQAGSARVSRRHSALLNGNLELLRDSMIAGRMQNQSTASGHPGTALQSVLTGFMKRRGSVANFSATKSSLSPSLKSTPASGDAVTPPGMTRRRESYTRGKPIRRPSGKLRPPEFSGSVGKILNRDMEVGILPILSIVDAVIAVLDTRLIPLGKGDESDHVHGLNIVQRIRYGALGEKGQNDLVTSGREGKDQSKLTEEGAERVMRMVATLLHHPAAGTMFLRELSGEDRIIDAFLDSLLSAVSLSMPLPRHWAIKCLWRCLNLYRDMKLLHGSSVSERGFIDAIKVSFAILGEFGVHDYQALLQILLNQVVLPNSKYGNKIGEGNTVEPFGKRIANPRILPLIFDGLVISDTLMLRRNALKDINYILLSKNDKNFEAFITEKSWHEWLLPLIGRTPYDPFYDEVHKRTKQGKNHHVAIEPSPSSGIKATLPKGPPKESVAKSQEQNMEMPRIRSELQQECLQLCLNIYAMVHSYVFRDQSGNFQISSILKQSMDTLQLFVGGCMTHDVTNVARLFLIGLASKVIRPKVLAQWKNEVESAEWGAFLSFIGVIKDFILKMRIPERANLNDSADFEPCDLQAGKEMEITVKRLKEDGHDISLFEVRCMLRRLTDDAARDIEEKKVMGIVNAPTVVGRKRFVGRKLNAKAAKLLLDFGMHLDPESFTCSDKHLVEVVCKLLTTLGYKSSKAQRRKKRRASISEQVMGQLWNQGVSSSNKVYHPRAEEFSMVSKLAGKRIALGAEMLQDFYDIQQLFEEVDSLSPTNDKNAGNTTTDDHIERVTEAFYKYMKRTKKRQKTGFISDEYSKKQVVLQMQGEIQKVKARKLIKAQSTKFMAKVEKAKYVGLEEIIMGEELAKSSHQDTKRNESTSNALDYRRLCKAEGPERFTRSSSTRFTGFHGDDLRRRASTKTWQDELASIGLSFLDRDSVADDDVMTDDRKLRQKKPPPPPGICNVCSKQTNKNNTVIALGKTWCLNHFRCSICDRTPPNLEYFEKDGLIFCAEDWLDGEFGGNTCATCYTPLTSVSTKASSTKSGHESGGYSVSGRVYHKDCLMCTNCSTPLRSPQLDEEGAITQIFCWNKRPFCETCYVELYRKCPGCGEDPGNEGESWCGKNWHGDCFRCRACGVKFQSEGDKSKLGENMTAPSEQTVDCYYTIDADDGAGEMPYCEEHFHQLFSPKCAECLDPIMSGQDMWRAMGRKYHKDCFVCTICSCSFPDGEFFGEGGRPYCETHYMELFGTKCYHCDKYITDEILNALDKTWHKECFICGGCGNDFPNFNYFGHGNRAYCRGCYCKRFASRCKGCGEYVIEDAVQISKTVGGEEKKSSWHTKCLVCTHCNCSLGINDHIFVSEENGLPYCERDFKALHMEVCNSCGKIIEDGTLIQVDNGKGGTSKFHADCFKCAGCNVILDGSFFNTDEKIRISEQVTLEHGEPRYVLLEESSDDPTFEEVIHRVQLCGACQNDRHAVFCRKCGLIISSESPSRSMGDGSTWHSECMCCVFCETRFEPGQQMAQWNGLLVCIDCHAQQFTPICIACGEQIIAGMPRLRVLGAMYHGDCLTCVECCIDVKSKPYRRDVINPNPKSGDAQQQAWSVCGEHRLESWTLSGEAMERIKFR